MNITVMAAVGRNGAIGSQGQIPWRLPADLRRFKQRTLGHVLVMGRLTYESIGRPLPGRTTVVVTRRLDWPDAPVPAEVRVAGGVREAIELARTLEPADGEVFVQGGGQIYAEALALVEPTLWPTRLAMTWVEAAPVADAFFPDVDWSRWHEVSRERFDGGEWVDYSRAV